MLPVCKNCWQRDDADEAISIALYFFSLVVEHSRLSVHAAIRAFLSSFDLGATKGWLDWNGNVVKRRAVSFSVDINGESYSLRPRGRFMRCVDDILISFKIQFDPILFVHTGRNTITCSLCDALCFHRSHTIPFTT